MSRLSREATAREIRRNKSNCGSTTTSSSMSSSSVLERVSMHTKQGWKGANQDAITVFRDFAGRKSDIFCEVFDGEVFEALDIVTGERAALKKIKLDDGKEGFPRQILREIKLLKKLDHENIIKLKEIVVSPGTAHGTRGSDDHIYRGDIYMVFEYMDHDLKKVLHHSIPSQVKIYMRQLLKGLHYCHTNNVLHRDIKGANLLLSGGKLLKLADFGLARPFTRDGSFTNHVITLWYRPPELLLGATNYAEAVDIWSVGCIFAEFLLKKPLFPGRTEQDQLSKIFELCGSPNEEIWPGVSKLPLYKSISIHPMTPTRRRLRDMLQNFDLDAVELIERMLILNPAQRISAQDALGAAYFN